MKEESKLKVNIIHTQYLGTYQGHRTIDFTLFYQKLATGPVGEVGLHLACVLIAGRY